MNKSRLKKSCCFAAAFIMSAGLTVMSGTEYALAAGRLEEFSDMVRTLDAGADAPVAGQTGTTPAKTQ
ncbi:MAG: hypothetical protein II156_04060, partial [Lachnospiraceae bacterium]|nr:hypothetical protein [Lachnospiraceae bacterium]